MIKPQVIVRLSTITPEDRQLIDNLLKATGIQEYDLTNIKYYRIPTSINNELVKVYIVFGSDTAVSMLLNHSYQKVILPEITSLYNTEENEEARLRAFNQLKELSNFIKFNSQPVSYIPKGFTKEYLLQIESYLKDNKLLGMTCLDTEGKKIYIYIHKPSQEPDILQISINELFAIVLAKDVLNLKDLVLDK